MMTLNRYINMAKQTLAIGMLCLAQNALSEIILDDHFQSGNSAIAPEGQVNWTRGGAQLRGGSLAKLETIIDTSQYKTLAVQIDATARRLDEGESLDIRFYNHSNQRLIGTLENSVSITRDQFVLYESDIRDAEKVRVEISLNASSYLESVTLGAFKVEAYANRDAMPAGCLNLKQAGEFNCRLAGRDYTVFIPSYPYRKVVVDLHGYQETVDEHRNRSGWQDIAEAKQLAVVRPQRKSGAWGLERVRGMLRFRWS